MIKIVAEKGIFEIRPNGVILQLYMDGQSKGEIATLPPFIRKGHVAIFGCRMTGARAIECIATGVIKEVK